MMKILHVIPALAYGFGGPTQAVLEMCKGLVKYGTDVTIFTTNADIKKKLDVPINKEVNLNGIKIFYFSIDFFHRYKFSFDLIDAIKKKIKDFDIIHIHSLFQFPTLISSYYARKFNKPYIIRPLGQLDPFLLRRHRLRKLFDLYILERKNIEYANYLHFTTEEEEKLARKSGFKFSSFVLPLGIDLENFKNLPTWGEFRKKYPETKGKRIILFLGRISFKKGLDILAEAFYQLCKIRDDLHLVIAGPDDEGYGKRIRTIIQKRNILDKVTFTGMLLGGEKLSVFRDSDIFVLPSYSENFGLAVIEAMACGLPVVVSDRVGIQKEILKNNAGIVVEPHIDSILEGIKKLLDDELLRFKIIESGKRLVYGCYSIEQIALAMIKIYKKILNITS